MSKKTIFTILAAFFALLLLITACNNDNVDDEKSPEAIYTEAAQTVAAQLTNMAEEEVQETATQTPEAQTESTPTQDTELPTATESSEEETQTTPTEEQQPTQSGPCSLDAEYVADVTIPDDTVLTPGETFTKTWQIMNAGSCTWGDGYTVYFVSGDDLSTPDNVSMTHGVDVPEGTMINVSIALTAPTSEGTYRADFKFKDPDGDSFGTIYVQIIVKEPTPVPSNTPQATETPIPTETPTTEPTETPSS